MSKQSTGAKIAEGLGVAALAATAAAAYYFTGKEGKKHQKQAKAWAKQAKTEMIKKIRSMEKVSQQSYMKASQEVLAKYKQVKNIDPKELKALGAELKKHWSSISKQALKLGAKKPLEKKKKK